MKILRDETGKVGWILLWALGVPIPVLVILFLHARLHIIENVYPTSETQFITF